MRCFVAIMAVEATHKIFLHMIDGRSAGGIELWVGFIIPGVVLLLVGARHTDVCSLAIMERSILGVCRHLY